MSVSRRGEVVLSVLIKERGLPLTVYDSDYKACLTVNKKTDGTYYYTMLDNSKGGGLKRGESFSISSALVDSWKVEPIDC
jgi:hypothetical protein